MLKRRFKNFIGISYEGELIQNGIKRLNIFNEYNLFKEHQNINTQMYRISRTRLNTQKRWNAILDKFGGDNIAIVHTLKADEQVLKEEKRFKPLAVRDFKSFITSKSFILGFLMFFFSMGNALLLKLSLFLMCFASLKNIFKRIIYSNPARNMHKIGNIVLSVFRKLGYIKSQKANCFVKVSKDFNGKVYEIELHNSTAHENNLFVSAIREIYERIDNPRYLIAYEYKRILHTRYFSVPSILAEKKEKAEMFYKEWQKYMGKGKLIYTRNEKGRKTLLRARKGSFDYKEKFIEQQQAIKM